MKLRRFIFFLIFIFSISSIVQAEVSPDLINIKKQGKITVGILKDDTPPFFMRDKNGQLIGFDVELAKRIGKELGVKVEFDRTAKTFDDVADLVSQKKIDMAISKLSINLTRSQKVSYTSPYIFIKSAILINRVKNFDIDKLGLPEILLRMNQPTSIIGIAKGTTHVGPIHQDFPRAKIIEFETVEEAFDAVTNGTIGFMQTHETNARNWFHLHPEKSVRVRYLLREDSISPIAIAVPWEKRDLVQWLNTYIDVVSKDGTLDRLKKYYVESFDWDKK